MAKTSKSAKTDRQKIIDDLKKKQKSADSRKGYAIVGVCVLIAVLIIGAAIFPRIKSSIDLRQFEGLELASIGEPASVCQDVTTKDATGVSNHVDTNVPVDYEDAPPAFGPHWNAYNLAPAAFSDKFYDESDRPAVEALVHNLEHGYTIMWYDETLSGEQVAQIQAIAKKFKADDDNFRYKFIAAPWMSSDEDGASFPEGQHVALTHWKGDTEASTGIWQYCSAPSGEALETFMADYPFTDAPEANAG